MKISEYKEQITELGKRFAKVQKEHDRQQIIYGQKMEELQKHGISDISEVDSKLAELKQKLEAKKTKLDAYLTSFEEKIQTIEEIMA